MGTRMIRDRSKDNSWWLMLGLFTLCVVGWSLAFSLKAGAGDSRAVHAQNADRVWQVEGYEQISISGSSEVELIQGEREGVYGRGDADDLERFEVFVEGRELIVRPKQRGWIRSWSADDVNLVIELRQLSELKLSGSGDLRSDSLKANSLRMSVSGSGDVDIDELAIANLELVISGSADVALSGAADDQSVRISGSADYMAADLSSQTARVRISGSADALLQVSDTLDAKVSGSGTVRYAGDPAVTRRVSGSGEIRPI